MVAPSVGGVGSKDSADDDSSTMSTCSDSGDVLPPVTDDTGEPLWLSHWHRSSDTRVRTYVCPSVDVDAESCSITTQTHTR